MDVSSVYDGTFSFLGGQNEVDNLAQGRNTFTRGVNVMLSRHSLTTRYGLDHIPITVDKYQEVYDRGKTQAFIPIPNTRSYLEIISGILFEVSPEHKTGRVVVIGDNKEDFLSSNLARINWSYGGDFIVLFDYPKRPVLYQIGRGARRSSLTRIEYTIDPLDENNFVSVNTPEVPPAELGAFNSDRLFIAEGYTITAGDAVGITNPDAPITFKDVLTPNAPYVDEFFDVGNSSPYEFITAMTYLKLAETTTGYGPLVISTNKNIYTANSSRPRSEWTTEGGGLLKLALPSISIAGQRASANVNNDLFFQDPQGYLRSLGTDLQNQKRWDDTALSKRVANLLDCPDPSLYKFSVIEYWDNKLFIFASPRRGESIRRDSTPVADYFFKGIIVLDFSPNADFAEGTIPAFLGVWTGALFSEMGVIENNLYIKGRVGERNALFQVRKDRRFDTYKGKLKNIKSRIFIERYGFSSRFNEKEIRSISLDIQNIKGDFSAKISYKPNGAPEYALYKSFSYKVNPCLHVGVGSPQSHSLDGIRLGSPEEISCNEATKNLVTRFKELDLKLELSGVWELRTISLRAETKIELTESNVQCFPIQGKDILYSHKEDSDFYFYQINSGENDVSVG